MLQQNLAIIVGVLALGQIHARAQSHPEITAAELRDHVEFLTSQDLQGRKTGTRGAAQAANYIADAMKACGLKPLGDLGGYFQEFEIKRPTAKGLNVIGMLEGNDPALKEQVVVVGAHYDHLGLVRNPAGPDEGTLYPGADDNASGVSGLLELVQSFANGKAALKRSIVFVAFSGEEEGLLGSRHYADHPPIPLQRTVAMVNLDMIGRLADHKLILSGTDTSPDLCALVRQCDPEATFDLKFAETDRGVPLLSDHVTFAKRKIPALEFFTGMHPDVHKPTDTAEKLNFEGMLSVVNFARRIAVQLDQAAELPKSEP